MKTFWKILISLAITALLAVGAYITIIIYGIKNLH